MHFNPQLFKVSIIQTKLFGPLDFELLRFHCIMILTIETKLTGPVDFELSGFHCITVGIQKF